MKFHVTQDHIYRGIAGWCSMCPVALCVAEALPGAEVTVSDRDVHVFRGGDSRRTAPLPDSAAHFVATFDADGEVFPFSFEIPTLNPL